MESLSPLFNQRAVKQLDPVQVQAMVLRSPSPFLLDVRTPQEYGQGHIKGVELIPLDELPASMDRIPKGREIICICESGSRSIAAASHLSEQGYRTSNLIGGMNRWIRAGLPIETGTDK